MLTITFEGLIATPFGYLMDFIYRLVGNYGLSLVIFAFMVQLAMYPVQKFNQKNAVKKREIRAERMRIKKMYAGKTDEMEKALFEFYESRKDYHPVLDTILSILPFFILIPIFQTVAQPIVYMLHETPDVTNRIIGVIYDAAPELAVSGYHQVTAITNIQSFAEIVKAQVPEVSARTLEGISYSFLGLDLSIVPITFIFGDGNWLWDWPHIGAILIPVIYMGRRIYMTAVGIYKKFATYAKEKKQAKANDEPIPPLPAPPIAPIIFLLLSLTALFSLPIAMNLYWLIGGIASSLIRKIFAKKKQAAKA